MEVFVFPLRRSSGGLLLIHVISILMECFFGRLARFFQNFSWSFSQVFDLSSTPSTTKKISGRPGARDPSAVKVSAPYDAWGPQNSRKTKIEKTRKKSKLWSAVYPPRMAPIGLRIWENAFQMIPIIWFFDTRKKNRGHFFHQKIFGREIYHYLPLFYHYLPLFYHYLPLFTTILHPTTTKKTFHKNTHNRRLASTPRCKTRNYRPPSQES